MILLAAAATRLKGAAASLGKGTALPGKRGLSPRPRTPAQLWVTRVRAEDRGRGEAGEGARQERCGLRDKAESAARREARPPRGGSGAGARAPGPGCASAPATPSAEPGGGAQGGRGAAGRGLTPSAAESAPARRPALASCRLGLRGGCQHTPHQ